MKYVFLFTDSDDEWEATPPDERERTYAEIGKWFAEHTQAGRITGGEELMPARTATTVRRQGERIVMTDGPFIESKETVGGFAVVEVPDLDAALALAKTWPGKTVEVRPVVTHVPEAAAV